MGDSGLDKRQTEVFELIESYVHILNAENVVPKLGEDVLLKLVDEIAKKYSAYKAEHGLIRTEAECYKVYAWCPYLLCELIEFNDSQIAHLIDVSIALLIYQLNCEDKELTTKWEAKLKKLTFKGFDKGLCNLTIEGNGLYVAFKSISQSSTVTPEQEPASAEPHVMAVIYSSTLFKSIIAAAVTVLIWPYFESPDRYRAIAGVSVFCLVFFGRQIGDALITRLIIGVAVSGYVLSKIAFNYDEREGGWTYSVDRFVDSVSSLETILMFFLIVIGVFHVEIKALLNKLTESEKV